MNRDQNRHSIIIHTEVNKIHSCYYYSFHKGTTLFSMYGLLNGNKEFITTMHSMYLLSSIHEINGKNMDNDAKNQNKLH